MQDRYKRGLLVGNYTVEYLGVTGHHVCSLLSKSMKIKIMGTYICTYIEIVLIICTINSKFFESKLFF